MDLSGKQPAFQTRGVLFRVKKVRRRILLAMGVLALLSLFDGRANAVNITPAQWAVLKKGNIINRVEPGSVAGEDQGVAIGMVNAPLAEVWKVIHENNDFKNFMPGMRESILVDPSVIATAKTMASAADTGDPRKLIQFLKKHRIAKMTGSTGYFFALLKVPWSPVHKWYIAKLEDVVMADQWFQHWGMIAGNMKTNNGSWNLVPLEGNKTLVTYTVYTNAGSLLQDTAGEGSAQEPAKPLMSGGPDIVVANGCASGDSANFYADKIRSAGFRVLRVGMAQTLNYESSEVIFYGPYYNQSLDILRLLPGKQKLLQLKEKKPEYDIYVVIGCSATDKTLTDIIEALRNRVRTQK